MNTPMVVIATRHRIDGHGYRLTLRAEQTAERAREEKERELRKGR